MHDAAAPRINKNSPAVMATRLAVYLEGVQAIGERLIEPPPTQRDIREAEREAHPEHVKHVRQRFAEGIPRIISRQSVDLLTHIRRVEYQLRCFILWLAAILVEKAQQNPDFLSTLFAAPRASAKAQNAGAFGDQQHSSKLNNNTPQVTTQAQLAGAAGDEQQESTISNYVWRQELQMRSLSAKAFPIGSFSITTPVVEGKRHRHRGRIRHLTPDSSRMVDASYLVARLARLPRILSRADQMAERLARKALSQGGVSIDSDPHLDPPFLKGRRRSSQGSSHALDTALPLEKEEMEGDHIVRIHHNSRLPDRGLVRLNGNAKPIPNPLYFEPLTRAIPPDKLWNSTEDNDERGDLTWLHYIASDTLNRTGFAPGPDAGACLPDLSRFEPPKLPQVRRT